MNENDQKILRYECFLNQTLKPQLKLVCSNARFCLFGFTLFILFRAILDRRDSVYKETDDYLSLRNIFASLKVFLFSLILLFYSVNFIYLSMRYCLRRLNCQMDQFVAKPIWDADSSWTLPCVLISLAPTFLVYIQEQYTYCALTTRSPSVEEIFVEIGCGVRIAMSVEEAGRYADSRVTSLQRLADSLTDRAAELKSQCRLVVEVPVI